METVEKCRTFASQPRDATHPNNRASSAVHDQHATENSHDKTPAVSLSTATKRSIPHDLYLSPTPLGSSVDRPNHLAHGPLDQLEIMHRRGWHTWRGDQAPLLNTSGCLGSRIGERPAREDLVGVSRDEGHEDVVDITADGSGYGMIVVGRHGKLTAERRASGERAERGGTASGQRSQLDLCRIQRRVFAEEDLQMNGERVDEVNLEPMSEVWIWCEWKSFKRQQDKGQVEVE